MGVNDILTQGAEPLFFLDYFVCGKLDIDVAEAVVRGVAEGCRQAGCVLIGGETAEHPGDFPNGEYDLAGFAVGVVDKEKILRPAAIVPGDILIGLASSGLHSNGYSLARKVVFEIKKFRAGDRIADLGRTIGEEMLEPTRIYAKIIRSLLRRCRVKGIAHVTGGGISGNLPRVFPEGRRAWIRRGSWTTPPIFRLIQEWGSISDAEMERTFNNGLGMILVIGKDDLSRVEGLLRRGREGYAIIGEVKKGEKGVTFTA
jgi:phosphoribosylformylglycinamidine cyclo-ligase